MGRSMDLDPARGQAMKTSRWAGVGMVLGALTALVWQAPASWLASSVQALSQERVQLRQPQGTV